MRRTIAWIALALPLCVQPALALDLPARPGVNESALIRVADLDGPTYNRRHADAYWYWRYRASYTRWMHNEYVRAGYPVRHRQFRTYERVVGACCQRYRHW